MKSRKGQIEVDLGKDEKEERVKELMNLLQEKTELINQLQKETEKLIS